MVDFSTSIIKINLHHSKSASAILTRSIAVVQTCIAIIQEPWLVKGAIKGLGSCGKRGRKSPEVRRIAQDRDEYRKWLLKPNA